MAEGGVGQSVVVSPSGKKRNRYRGRPRAKVETSSPEPEEMVPLPPLPGTPRVLSREQHCISRKNIDADCLKVMQRLIRHGYRAFLVGGGVRDLLLERTPKDFDVGTDASPEEVRKLFRNSRIIGRRFRLNHVFFYGGKTIEVATFRGETEASEDGQVQTLAKDNTFGDAQTDALRRDLTINGLFYDLSTFSVVDYVGGIEDLENKTVRVIGDPEVRFTEDPVRMIRAIRHAARTNFEIEPKTLSAIHSLANKIALVPKARLFEEFQRELVGGYAKRSFELLEKTGILPNLFPHLAGVLRSDARLREIIYLRLSCFDARALAGESPRLGLLFGALLFDTLTPESGVGDSRVLEYWRTDPEEREVVDRPPLVVPSTAPSKRRISPLMQSIDAVFDAVGLPRKERERLERALVSRLSLFEFSPNDSFGKRFLNSSAFDDALLLAELVDTTEQYSDVLAAWRTAQLTGGEHKAPRRRNRTRRRRRSGNRAPSGGSTANE